MSSLCGDKDHYERSEYPEKDFSIPINGVDLDFFLTCQACPEQYDVFIGDKQVGYVRLRWGALRAAYPDVTHEYGFTHIFPDGWKGEFSDEVERDFYLQQVAFYLYKKHALSC